MDTPWQPQPYAVSKARSHHPFTEASSFLRKVVLIIAYICRPQHEIWLLLCHSSDFPRASNDCLDFNSVDAIGIRFQVLDQLCPPAVVRHLIVVSPCHPIVHCVALLPSRCAIFLACHGHANYTFHRVRFNPLIRTGPLLFTYAELCVLLMTP